MASSSKGIRDCRDVPGTRPGLPLTAEKDSRPLFLTLFLTYLLAHLGSLCWRRAREEIGRRRIRRIREKHLRELTPEERGYQLPYIHDRTSTQTFDIDDGVAGGLQGKEILYRSSNMFDVHRGVPYNLQPWARTYLTQHPELLADATLPTMPNDETW